MKSLVTGGSGYFGSLLVERIGADKCAVFDISDAEDRSSSTAFHQGDVRDYRSVLNAFEGVDVVYHNVAQVPLAKDRHLFRSVNIDGTENVLKAALEKGVRKVVYTSSSAVFGVPKHNPVTEATHPEPGEAYGQAKYEGELLCEKYRKLGLDVSIVRPRTILGHGRLGIFQILFEWIREGKNVPVLGSGDNLYQFVHAEDLADACILAGERAGSATYNCGADEFGTMRQALEALCKHAKTGSRVRSVPVAPAVMGMKLTSALGLSPLGAYHALMYGQSMYFDVTKAKAELGWKPKWSNEAMFIQSYDWYLAHRDSVLAAHGASHHRSAVKQGVLKIIGWGL
ncbi:NAD-dependent epimerase/dehydratase family protein [Xanthomonas sacchari]|uniref:NAD-dependent epimerase/dehydratase family protein n=1 Tax=Xanthomonas sacchari TaxID=56458 RepID=UPI00225DF9EA|nr:NAD-dependent epimerase/dehydratase family protein [Xanthomonas sacchari]MCW0422200.1 UDP-glucose 4-epimerase [Xanthomonas sacchari]